MDVQQSSEGMVLLVFLTLLLTVVLILMLIILAMVIIMVYMTLISLKELQRDIVNKSISHSTGITCSHCSSTFSGTLLVSSDNNLTTAHLQTEATNITEALQPPTKNLHSHSTFSSNIDAVELDNNVGKDDDFNIETTSTLNYIHSTLSENENEMIDVVQLVECTDLLANDSAVIAKNNNDNNNLDGEIIDCKNNDSISSLNATSNTVSNNNIFDGSEIQNMKINDLDDEKIIEPTVKLSNSLRNIEMCQIEIKKSCKNSGIIENLCKTSSSSNQDTTNDQMSLMQGETNLEYIANDNIIDSEHSDGLSKINVREESDEEFSKKVDIAIKNTEFCNQKNGIIDCKTNGSTQNSENVSDLNTHSAYTENESYHSAVNQISEKVNIQCFDTLSSSASQTSLSNGSSKKVISTSMSNESLSNESSKNFETEETPVKLSTTADIYNGSSSIITDQNTILTDLSIKSLPENSVNKVQETEQKLPSKLILQTTEMDDSPSSYSTNLSQKEDISNTNKNTLENRKSNESKSLGIVEHSISPAKSIEDTLSSLFKEADEMYQQMEYDNLYVLLKHSKIDQKNDEFLWRIARVTWQRAMKETNETEQLSLHKEALDYVHSALAQNETNGSVHRWISIITDYVARATDVRTRVAQSVVCRDHMFRAVELNPNDGTSWYLLGFWHYCAAELPWYQRRIAKALFSTDFNGTYEQALDYFLKGYKNNPEFYSTNVYMIGRCYQKMGRRGEAITWIRLARDYRPIRTWNDEETHQDATKTLKKLESK